MARTRSIRLRRWQKEALDALDVHGATDFLAVATPGAGKTTFALTAVVRELATRPERRTVVVAPTSHLKLQWSRAAAAFGLHLEPSWSSMSGRLPADMHGIVVTYQQVAANPDALARHADRCIVVLDELHHAGDERAWGAAIRRAFEAAPRRLALSGTPFRSDTHAIPFVRYDVDEATPDYEYGYADALADRRVVRPVWFPRINGFMEWTAPDGTANAASFDDALDPVRSGQRLRSALSLDGEWLPSVLNQANEALMALRVDQPDAAGLVIATDQDHARGIAQLLHARHRARAVVTTSDDPSASSRIARFAEGTEPWIVAVRMVSEGVDIPRLRLGVFATTTATELFFRQAVGRFVRHTGERAPRERAWLFIPDDPRLRTFAGTISEARRHILRRRSQDGERPALEDPDPGALDEPDVGDEQLSLFAVLSAEVIEGSSTFDDDPNLDGLDEDDDDTSVPLEVPAPPPPGSGRWSLPLGEDLGGRPLSEVKSDLRRANADLATELARFSGLGHREVNGRLNRSVGIRRIDDATLEQLRRRADRAERWLGAL